MKINILLFFCLWTCVAFSQKNYVKVYDDDGNLREEGWMKDQQKEGYWYFYYANTRVHKKGHYKNNLPTNYWYIYREDGGLEKEGHYENGKKNKWWLYYDLKGNISHKCQLKDNLKNGYCLMYSDNKLVKASKFINNKKIKEWDDFSSFKEENNLNDLK